MQIYTDSWCNKIGSGKVKLGDNDLSMLCPLVLILVMLSPGIRIQELIQDDIFGDCLNLHRKIHFLCKLGPPPLNAVVIASSNSWCASGVVMGLATQG